MVLTVDVQDWAEVHHGDAAWCSLFSISSDCLRVDTEKLSFSPAVQMQNNES